jgi:TonB family protein
MTHGVHAYFEERRRAARRVSLLSASIGGGMLAVMLLPTLNPALHKALRDTIEQTTHFGYEGPEQFVHRIELQQFEGSRSRLQQLGAVQPLSSRRGGTPDPSHSSHPNARPQPDSRVHGPGTEELDLTMRAVSRMANVPVVQSEDLIIDHLVRPDYPASLLDQNVEGNVMVQALVDTIGRVVEVQVMASSGETLFERAAEAAVWQCRFQPYRRKGGTASEVYAVFRFSFRIVD